MSQSATRVPAGIRPAQPRRHLIFGAVSLALLMVSIDQTVISTALGVLQQDLHAGVNWTSWTITVYALGQVVTLPIAGRISDQYGRRRVFLVAIVIFTLASLCCGLADNISELIALRAVQAIGGGAFIPSAAGIVTDAYGPHRDRAVSLFASIFPIGGIIGPVLGGLFLTYWSWRGIFLLNVPIGALLFVLAAALVPRTPGTAQQRVDVLGVALPAVAILSAMFAVTMLGTVPTRRTVAVCLLSGVLAAVCTVMFVRRSRRVANPAIPPVLLTGRGLGVLNGVNYLWGIAILGLGGMLPLYAQQRYGLDSLAAGTLLTARAVGMIAVAGLAALVLRRSGNRPPMLVGFAVSAVGLILLAVPPQGLDAYGWLSMSAALAGIGAGISLPASNTAALDLAPADTAAVIGLRVMFRQCGGITGVSLISTLAARSANPGIAESEAFLGLGLLLLCVAPLILRVPPRNVVHHGSLVSEG